MKKGLLGSTAIIGATVLMAGVASAAEAPTWKLTGNVNFQAYNVDQDRTLGANNNQSIFFGVDESELQLNVSGTADNGLNYGFKIELNANKDDNAAADEVRLQLSGGWGTLQMGDEDGASDIMVYGGETIMGATGGFDGDFGDVVNGGGVAADDGPNLIGDTGDSTKISYFSPRFSGFQVGASWTPNTADTGDTDGFEDTFINAIELGANYDNSFGGVRVRASAVYLMDSADNAGATTDEASAWAVGGVVGFGPVSVAASYGDSGSSHDVGGNDEASYWNAAASFETGPLYFSAGYHINTQETGGGVDEDESTVITLTADYSVAPGLGVYAEVDMFEFTDGSTPALDNDGTVIILGANVSF